MNCLASLMKWSVASCDSVTRGAGFANIGMCGVAGVVEVALSSVLVGYPSSGAFSVLVVNLSSETWVLVVNRSSATRGLFGVLSPEAWQSSSVVDELSDCGTPSFRFRFQIRSLHLPANVFTCRSLCCSKICFVCARRVFVGHISGYIAFFATRGSSRSGISSSSMERFRTDEAREWMPAARAGPLRVLQESEITLQVSQSFL